MLSFSLTQWHSAQCARYLRGGLSPWELDEFWIELAELPPLGTA